MPETEKYSVEIQLYVGPDRSHLLRRMTVNVNCIPGFIGPDIFCRTYAHHKVTELAATDLSFNSFEILEIRRAD